MSIKRIAIAVVIPSLFSVAVCSGQTPESRPATAPTVAVTKDSVATDEEQKDQMRRNQARSLLVALSSDARTFNNTTLRAKSLVRIADLLWDLDVDQAKIMFRKAWEAAESADIENDKNIQEEIRQQKLRNNGGSSVSPPPSLRREVIRLVTPHDIALGEEFGEKLSAQSAEAARKSNPRFGGLSPALTHRLEAAYSLLMSGDVDGAVQSADIALGKISIRGLDFLVDLRIKAPTAADKRYATWLTNAANNSESDANTVSLFLSYLTVPHDIAVYYGGRSAMYTSLRNRRLSIEVSPELRTAFFQFAAGMLLKPLPTPGPDGNTDILETNYLVLKRLLPFLEQNAPPNVIESFQAQFNLLDSQVSEFTRRLKSPIMNPDEKLAESLRTDQERSLLERLAQAKNSSERDSLQLQLALLHSQTGDMRARDEVSKIDDLETRKAALAFIDMSLARKAIEKNSSDQALELVMKGELNHVQKTWVLTKCARRLLATDKQRATELIDAAITEAQRIDGSDPLFPGALLAIANALLAIDPTRVWEATFAAVKAANSASGFTGEDASLNYRLDVKGPISSGSIGDPDFNVAGIFGRLAHQDFDRAVELARGFQGEGPRAMATIALAKSVLEKKGSKN
jgi:hypothetical protein